MGLTSRESETFIQTIEDFWRKIRIANSAEQDRILKAVCKDWETDPRVIAFRDALQTATGRDWLAPTTMFSRNSTYSRDSTFNELLTNWPAYESGTLKGSLYDALKDVGWSPPPETSMMYRGSTQCSAFMLALRTTRSKWVNLQDPYAEMVMDLGFARTFDDIQRAVSKFMGNL